MIEALQLHHTKACSGVLLGDFGSYPDRLITIKRLYALLSQKFPESASIDIDQNVYIKDMSVVTAMTLSTSGFWDQSQVDKIFRDIGMTAHGPHKNRKNGTSPIFWVMEATAFDKAIRELYQKEVENGNSSQ